MMNRLQPDFRAKEFFGKGRCGVTTLAMVCTLQDIRREPIRITGTGNPAAGVYVTEYITGGRECTLKQHDPAGRHIPVYGPGAYLPDSIMELMEGTPNRYQQFLRKAGKGGIDPETLVAVIALLQAGYREEGVNRTVFNREMGSDGIPWCAVLYHWCVRQAYSVLQRSPEYTYNIRYTNSRYNFDHAPYITKRVEEIRAGQAVIWRQVDHKVAGHTAVCVRNNPEEGYIILAEGNLSNKVTLKLRRYNRLNTVKQEFIGGCSYITADRKAVQPVLCTPEEAGVATGEETTR